MATPNDTLVKEEVQQSPETSEEQAGEEEVVEGAAIHIRVITPDGEEIALDGISSAECVLAIRSAIAEHPRTAHFSSYSLMLETNGLPEGDMESRAEANGMEPVINVGEDGRVQLNDVFELQEYAVAGLVDGCTVHMQRSPYDLRSCRVHVRRLNELLSQPPAALIPASDSTDKYAESLLNIQKATEATNEISELTQDQKTGADHSAKLQALQREARKWLLRAEAQRREVDRVIASRIPDLKPELSLLPNPTLDGCSLGTVNSQNLGDFFPTVMGPAMLDCEDCHVPVEVAALEGLAKYDEQFLQQDSTSSKLLTNNEAAGAGKKKGKGKKGSTPSSSQKKDEGSELPLSGCIRYVCASAWNPPPPERKLAGDIIYLEVGLMEKLEDKDSNEFDSSVIHITGTPNGWFVNQSRSPLPTSMHQKVSAVFNPEPRLIGGKYMANPELFGLLASVSKVFTASWARALKVASDKASRHECPLSMIGLMVDEGRIDSVVIKHSWAVPSASTNPSSSSDVTSGTSHKFDWHRAQEDANSTAAGSVEERGSLRDWNEEFQCFQELPVTTMMEKINRAKMLYKVWLEFQEAAVSGATAISLGIIPPINPTEPERQHVFVFNNTFFSYGVDSKDAYKVMGGDEAACKSARHDFRNVQLLDYFQATNQPPVTAEAQAALEAAINETGTGIETSPPSSPSQSRLCTLATALVDLPCGGRRLVAQSVIPGILSGDQISKLVLGAILHGTPLVQDETMKAKLEEASKFFHIASREMPTIPLHTPPSTDPEETLATKKAAEEEKAKGGDTMVLHGAVELKGIVGSDSRKYILDCLRITPRDANFVPSSLGGTGGWDAVEKETKEQSLRSPLKDDHVALLRPELVQRWRKRQEELKTNQKDEKKSEEEKAKFVLAGEDLLPDEEPLNVNVFMPFICASDKKVAVEDEERVRKVSRWLWNCILPSLTDEVRKGSVIPLDGNVLVELLHSFGVNVRYLGRLAQLAQAEEQSDFKKAQNTKETMNYDGYVFPLFWRRMLELEMVVRAAKHVFRRLLDQTPEARLRPSFVITQFLNALLGKGGSANQNLTREFFEEFDASLVNASASSSSSFSSKKSSVQKKVVEPSGVAAVVGKEVAGEEDTQNLSASALKRLKKKKTKSSNNNDSSSSISVASSASSKVSSKNDAELQQQLAQLVLSPPPTLGDKFNGPILWALIAQEIRNRYRYELDLWPNPQNEVTSANAGAGVWKGFNAEQEASKPCLLRRICQKLGLRVKAKSFAFKTSDTPFELSDILDAVPVPKSSGSGSGPPGWSKALFQRSGPLSYLLSEEELARQETEKKEQLDAEKVEKAATQAAAADQSGEGANVAKVEEKAEFEEEVFRSQALSALPFGSGNSQGSGGHPSLTPCPLNEVDELLSMAYLQTQNRQWGPVYELAQQAFALAQTCCGPLHRSTALALEYIAKALFNLGDPETAVTQQTKALAIHEQLGGFDTPDVAAAHSTLATYHHRLGQMEVSPRAPNTQLPNLDRRLDKAARHIRAAAYLYELMGGPLHPEIAECYNKLGQFYHEASSMCTHHLFPKDKDSLFQNKELEKALQINPNQVNVSDQPEAGGLGALYAVNALRCYRESLRRSTLVERYHLNRASDTIHIQDEISVFKEAHIWSELCKCDVPILGEDVLNLITEETAKLAEQLGGGGEGAPVSNSKNANQPALLTRILQAQSLHTMAVLYERPLGMGKEAIQLERVAYRVFRLLLGDQHHLSTTSAYYLQRFTEATVRASAETKALKQQAKQPLSKKQQKQQAKQTSVGAAGGVGAAAQSSVTEAERIAADKAMQAMIAEESKSSGKNKKSSKKK